MDAQLTRFLRDVIRITATRSANNTRDLQLPGDCLFEDSPPRACMSAQLSAVRAIAGGRRARCQWKIQSGEATVTVLPQFGGAGVARGMHAELSKLLARSLHSQAAQTTELRSQRRQ